MIEELPPVCVPVAEGVGLRVITRLAAPGTHPAGAPVLLVHGLASNARMWDGVGEELARLGHPSIAVDQRGHGRSDKPDIGYDFATLASDLLAVMDATGLERPVIAGQSWGASVVLELAARHPERVRGVVCVDGAVDALQDVFPDWPAAESALTPPHLVGTPLVELETRFRAYHPDWPESGIAGGLANFRIRDDGTVEPWLTLPRHLAILHHIWEHRPVEVYPRLRVPVALLLAGDPERKPARAQAVAAIASSGADVRVTWFNPGDHDLHAQFPRRVAEALAALADEAPG